MWVRGLSDGQAGRVLWRSWVLGLGPLRSKTEIGCYVSWRSFLAFWVSYKYIADRNTARNVCA